MAGVSIRPASSAVSEDLKTPEESALNTRPPLNSAVIQDENSVKVMKY